MRHPEAVRKKSDLISRSSALAASSARAPASPSAPAFAYVCFSFSIFKCPFVLRCVVGVACCQFPSPSLLPLPRPTPGDLPCLCRHCPAFILFCVHVTCWKINNNKKRQQEENQRKHLHSREGVGVGVGVGGATNTRVTLLNVC